MNIPLTQMVAGSRAGFHLGQTRDTQETGKGKDNGVFNGRARGEAEDATSVIGCYQIIEGGSTDHPSAVVVSAVEACVDGVAVLPAAAVLEVSGYIARGRRLPSDAN
jgi:histidinol dehydrogenase